MCMPYQAPSQKPVAEKHQPLVAKVCHFQCLWTSLLATYPCPVCSDMEMDVQAAPGRPARMAGPSREAIVFMIGGGNYLEYESLTTWASRAQPAKSVVYGATDLLTGEAFVQQLAELGRRSGA